MNPDDPPSRRSIRYSCFEPADDGDRWTPWFDDGSYPKVGSAPQKLEDGCWSLTMDRGTVEGRTSVAVASLEGMPTGPLDSKQPRVNPKTIRGP